VGGKKNCLKTKKGTEKKRKEGGGLFQPHIAGSLGGRTKTGVSGQEEGGDSGKEVGLTTFRYREERGK